jgi:signal transduction histidine kinase
VSAIARNAALLESRLDDVERAVGTLDASVLTAAQRARIAAARAACSAACPVLSPIEQADREDAIANWLAAHGVGVALVGPLADTALTLDALEPLGASLRGPQLEAVLRWAAAGHALRELAVDIREAALRIAGLVDAVKGFTQMDQAGAAEAVDVAEGLANTVAMFGAKAHAKSAVIAVDVPADIPRVHAFAGELNQIWANLLDNALDAVTDSGRIDIIARREPRRVVVQVIDNGGGIPPEVRPHIFDPFFTTKPVGQGTGLGLDIVGRLVGHNAAEIDVDSRPGRTAFTVSLPIAEASAAR